MEKEKVYYAWLLKDDDDYENASATIEDEKNLALEYQNVNGDIYSRISLVTPYSQIDSSKYTFLGYVVKKMKINVLFFYIREYN